MFSVGSKGQQDYLVFKFVKLGDCANCDEPSRFLYRPELPNVKIVLFAPICKACVEKCLQPSG